MDHPTESYRNEMRQRMAEKAASLGISPEEYAARLSYAGAQQRQWQADLADLGWDHSKSPTENLERIRIKTAVCGV